MHFFDACRLQFQLGNVTELSLSDASSRNNRVRAIKYEKAIAFLLMYRRQLDHKKITLQMQMLYFCT